MEGCGKQVMVACSGGVEEKVWRHPAKAGQGKWHTGRSTLLLGCRLAPCLPAKSSNQADQQGTDKTAATPRKKARQKERMRLGRGLRGPAGDSTTSHLQAAADQRIGHWLHQLVVVTLAAAAVVLAPESVMGAQEM